MAGVGLARWESYLTLILSSQELFVQYFSAFVYINYKYSVRIPSVNMLFIIKFQKLILMERQEKEMTQ